MNNPPPPATAPPRRILVVDDASPVAETIQAMLSELGHAVDISGDGQDALNKFAPGKYDLIITDYSMPKMNGLELAQRRQKARSWAADTPGDGLYLHSRRRGQPTFTSGLGAPQAVPDKRTSRGPGPVVFDGGEGQVGTPALVPVEKPGGVLRGSIIAPPGRFALPPALSEPAYIDNDGAGEALQAILTRRNRPQVIKSRRNIGPVECVERWSRRQAGGNSRRNSPSR